MFLRTVLKAVASIIGKPGRLHECLSPITAYTWSNRSVPICSNQWLGQI